MNINGRKIGITLFLGALIVSSILSITAIGDEKIINLPEPEMRGKMPVEEAIKERRSERTFTDTPLTLKQLSQILWAAQGITEGEKRAAPSPELRTRLISTSSWEKEAWKE
jgi:hypothetical protein